MGFGFLAQRLAGGTALPCEGPLSHTLGLTVAQLQDGRYCTWLSKTTSEKDLGIVVDHKLNVSQQCDVATKKATAILDFINRSIVSKSCKMLVPYSALVRPHLEYCVQFWTPRRM